MAEDKNTRIASDVLAAVGGKDNVTTALHCMTRLRLNLKDDGLADLDALKKIDGVLGSQWSGGQLQVIIGQNVPKVYKAVAKQGIDSGGYIDESLDAPKEKLTLKGVGNAIMGYLAGSMVPLIPVVLAAGLIKALETIIGPGMLGWISAESDLYVILEFVYNAAFYFLPVLIGFNAAKVLGINQMLGAYMGCILIAPGLIELASAEGASLSFLGIPVALNNYSQTLLPVLLSVWVMSYVWKFLNHVVLEALSTVFTPFLTIVIMTPISLIVLAPAGSFLGGYISNGLYAFGEYGGFIAVAVVAALWEILTLTGMHMVIGMLVMNELFTTGVVTGVGVSGGVAIWAAFGVALGAFFRLRKKSDKTTQMGFFISGLVGGVTEPVLYGTCFKYIRTFVALMIGGFVGGAYAGIANVTMYAMGVTNVLSLMMYAGGGVANLVNGIIACMLSMAVSAVCTYFFGFSREDIEGEPTSERDVERLEATERGMNLA